MPKGIVWKVLNDATGLVKLDLVRIDDHFNHAVMQMLIACLAHHFFLSWQLIFASTDTLEGYSQPTSSLSTQIDSMNERLQYFLSGTHIVCLSLS